MIQVLAEGKGKGGVQAREVEWVQISTRGVQGRPREKVRWERSFERGEGIREIPERKRLATVPNKDYILSASLSHARPNPL